MALTGFNIQNDRIPHAEAAGVPRVMIIAGPNGVGKSTLLYALRGGSFTQDVSTKVLYQGPHRVLRSTQVQRRWLGGPPRWLQDLLGSGDVSGFEGLNFQNSARTPANVDEAGSAIKHILGKIENRRQTLLARTVDRLRANATVLDPKDLSDVYAPIRTLTEHILPHLRFREIDFNNEDNIRILWDRKSAGADVPIDIDDLSSGEKAIIVLFLPLLEDELQANLAELETFGAAQAEAAEESGVIREHRVILIDEPEQHLHPDLQGKILAYMRRVSEAAPTQFIITTHSPTILDQAFDTELFVLSEPTGDQRNQLKRVSTNAERLEALKQLTGSTYFLTTGRVIVCIEGERDADPEKPTDARLLELLYPRATSVTLVPTTGKGNVITTVQRLREKLDEDTFRISVRGLVDADQSQDAIEGIETLPVCMIENLLLDADSMFSYLNDAVPGAFGSAADVLAEMKVVARALRSKEITLRLRRRLKPKTIRMEGATIAEIKSDLASKISDLQGSLPSDEALGQMVDRATRSVDQILADGTELDQFRGKEILAGFYQRHIAPKNIAYNRMCLELAKRVSEKGHVAARLDPIFDRLRTA